VLKETFAHEEPPGLNNEHHDHHDHPREDEQTAMGQWFESRGANFTEKWIGGFLKWKITGFNKG